MEIHPGELLPLDAELPDDTAITESVAAHVDETDATETTESVAAHDNDTDLTEPVAVQAEVVAKSEPVETPTTDLDMLIAIQVAAFTNEMVARTGNKPSERARKIFIAKTRARMSIPALREAYSAALLQASIAVTEESL